MDVISYPYGDCSWNTLVTGATDRYHSNFRNMILTLIVRNLVGERKIYLHFLKFLNTEMLQVVDIIIVNIDPSI